MKPYQALTNVSVPQRDLASKDDRRTDLAAPGERIELTEREAAHLLSQGAVRPWEQHNEPLPRLTGRQLSGPMRVPAVSSNPNDTGPRPDPAGSSRLTVLQDVEPGSNTLPAGDSGADELFGSSASALDLPPGTPANTSGGLTLP